MDSSLTQPPTQAPAQPSYILRGHSTQIHAVQFFRQNTRLLTGDADGWVVIWNLPVKRPVGVWKPHNNAILGLAEWDEDRHGRDGKICVWQLREQDEAGLSKTLPVDVANSERRTPWLLHSLPVHTLNFCSFAACRQPPAQTTSNATGSELTVAVSGVQDGSIHLISLPKEERFAMIPPPKDIKTGMLMAIGLGNDRQAGQVLVIAGYESGHAAVWRQHPDSNHWQAVYLQKVHAQPVMSLGVAGGLGYFFTSSADAIIGRHPMREFDGDSKTVQTKHAGQQSLMVRTDEKIFATAGWDGRARVYSAKSMKELAVLKWHKEGCYALAFAAVNDEHSTHISRSATQDETIMTGRELTVSAKRVAKTKAMHWMAAGSKDGKVSLWEIY